MNETAHDGPRVILLHEADSVLVGIDKIPAGASIRGITAKVAIPRGHKMSIRRVEAGEPITKFGQIIGFAGSTIEPGEWVHTQNVVMRDFHRDERNAEVIEPEAGLLPEVTSFQGYHRADGRLGTRNYIALLTSVNCSAAVTRLVAREIERSDVLKHYPNIDGVIPLVHGLGCAMDSQGAGYEVLSRTQWGYATNPNIGGVLMTGLGCEVFQIGRWKKTYGISESETFRSMSIQDVGGTKKTVEAGVAAVMEMLPGVNAVERKPAPASKLMLALQCGGSDGYSGVTANPALGAASDLLVALGGTAILSETPEIYGAEHLLYRRAVDGGVSDKLKTIIAWWEDYAARNGGKMDNNPSPGNKLGGLTTILEKSLGAVAKGGRSPLTAVYHYAEPISKPGLVFMDTPGYDPVAATGQVAGGANIMCFTTGRGSAFGCKPTPSIKLATNNEMYEHLSDDMDINCGDILDGVSIEDKGRQIFREILEVASGKRTKSEQLGYGDAEFVPWPLGATM